MYTHLIHISDLHVRAGDKEKARISEYSNVFDKFIIEISALQNISTSLIIISGDIFHNKTYIGVQGVTLLLEFISKLLDLAPVIAISGNHDILQQDSSTNIDTIDMLEIAFTNSKRKYKFEYLKTTGHYEFENIGIGVVSIKDVLRTTSGSGIVDNLPIYPDPSEFSENINIKIALFHGSVFKNGGGGYPIKWFDGYDFGVFGDYHKQQVNNTDGFIWGYPGSLIQQDVGESTDGHGYLLWNIAEKNATAHDIKNDYGAISIFKKENEWYVRFSAKNIHKFDEAVTNPIFPKYPKIKFISESKMDSELCELLKQNNIDPLAISVSTIDENVDIETNLTTIQDMNSKENWIKYIKEIYPDIDIKDYIEKPQNTICISYNDSIPEEIKSKIKQRNEIIIKCIEKYEALNTISNVNNKNVIKFKYITWDYILCYGKSNYIDFTNMQNKITLINGKNAMGKSAFLDVITLCIYGEPTSIRSQINMGKTLSAKIINDQKPSHEGACISLIFQYGNDKIYEIVRSFNTQSKDEARINTYNLTIYEINESEKIKTVIAEMALATAWIAKYFGTLQNMELSNMMCQIDINNFFVQSNDTQRGILERAMNMESISAYSEIIAESIKAYKYITDALKTFKSGMKEHSHIKITKKEITDFENLKKDIEDTVGKIKLLDEKRLELKIKNIFNAEDIALDDKIIDSYIEKYYIENVATFSEKEIAEFEAFDAETDEAADEAADADANADTEEEPKCSMGIETIEKMQKHYNLWVSKQEVEWINNPDKVSIEIENIEDKIFKYSRQLEYYEKLSVNRPTTPKVKEVLKISAKNLEEFIADLAVMKNRQIELLKNRVIPCRLKENKDSWLKKYTKWLKQVGDADETADSDKLKNRLHELVEYTSKIKKKYEKITLITEKIDQIEKEILEIDKLPYNPACEACKLQTHRKRFITITDELNIHKSELAKLNKSVVNITDLDDLYKEIEELPSLIAQRELYEATYESMNDEVDAWEKAEIEWIDAEKNSTELAEIENTIIKNEWNIYDSYKNILQKAKSSYDENKTLLDKMKIFIEEYDDYREEYNTIEDNIELINKWKKWYNRKKRNEYKIYIQCKNYTYWSQLKKYKEYIVVNKEFIELNAKLELLRNKYTILGKNIDDSAQYDTRLNDIEDAYSILMNKYELLQQIQKCIIGDTKKGIDGFRHWIFTNKALPLIEGEMNNFLSEIDNIQVHITFNSIGFIYTISDRGNKPSLNTISGYQKFIVNLAMRMALTRIGNNININTLFIDEGFTSFDTINIAKIRDIFNILLKRFNNIMIVSHMDIVKDNIDARINIERCKNNKTSKIYYGEEYPIYKSNEKKKGRPKKNI